MLGGRRIGIVRPRARAIEAGELALPSFTWAAQADPLDAAKEGSFLLGRARSGSLREAGFGYLRGLRLPQSAPIQRPEPSMFIVSFWPCTVVRTVIFIV